MKLVISDPKSGKSYPKTIEDANDFFGKKTGETVSLDRVGAGGYEARITGGSDKQGFPMKADLAGTGRKKVFLTLNKKTGQKKRISRRGNTVSSETAQLNLTVTKHGDKSLSELIAPDKKEEKVDIKSEMIKQSIDAAGKKETAEKMAKEEFKKGEKKR